MYILLVVTFGHQYRCNQLSGKARLRNDPRVDRDIKQVYQRSLVSSEILSLIVNDR